MPPYVLKRKDEIKAKLTLMLNKIRNDEIRYGSSKHKSKIVSENEARIDTLLHFLST